MPEIIVKIKYDEPVDPYWMNPDNVALCLHAYCKNTKFQVDWAPSGDPWKNESGQPALRDEQEYTMFFSKLTDAEIDEKVQELTEYQKIKYMHKLIAGKREALFYAKSFGPVAMPGHE